MKEIADETPEKSEGLPESASLRNNWGTLALVYLSCALCALVRKSPSATSDSVLSVRLIGILSDRASEDGDLTRDRNLISKGILSSKDLAA